MMPAVFTACGRAVLSQLHPRMLLLTIAPFFLSVLLWAVILYFSLQPMIDWLQAYFLAHDGFRLAGSMLGWLGSTLATGVVVPLIAMWVFLPLMILTALAFIGLLAMPTIVRHVGGRHYPQLEKRKGGGLFGSFWAAFLSFVVFIALWLVSLPILAIPPLGFILPPLLWGWLTYRVLTYDALAEHADKSELRAIRRKHRWPLLLIGTVTGMMGAAPTFLWLGGVLSVVLFPFFAAFSIWLYVLVFVFTGLWFAHYCLHALAADRAGGALARHPCQPPLKDIN